MARRTGGRGERRLTGPGGWLERHTRRAPAALRSRVLQCVEPTEPELLAGNLAAAGRRLLEGVASHAGDRSVALDLLAADALITLALLAEAERRPDRLGEFAASLVRVTPTTP